MTTATKMRSATRSAKQDNSVADIDWRATLIEAMEAEGHLGNTYCRFYDYSFLNCIRLLMQGVNEPVATYRRWLEIGFQVQKGMKAKMVLAPIVITKRDENGQPKRNPETGKPETVLVGFRESRTVFTFSDTDGDELPDIELPAWDTKTALEALNVKRNKFRLTRGNTQGYSSEVKGQRAIAINPAAKYPAKTLLHELAHIVLGHCKQLADDPDESERHRGIKEFEAEATAYLVAKELDLITWDPAESRGYIRHWLDHEDDDAVTDKNISRIFAAANKILVAGRKSND